MKRMTLNMATKQRSHVTALASRSSCGCCFTRKNPPKHYLRQNKPLGASNAPWNLIIFFFRHMPRISVWLKIWDTLRPGGVTRRGTCRGGICSICEGVWADGLCQGASVRMPGFPSRIFTLWQDGTRYSFQLSDGRSAAADRSLCRHRHQLCFFAFVLF